MILCVIFHFIAFVLVSMSWSVEHFAVSTACGDQACQIEACYISEDSAYGVHAAKAYQASELPHNQNWMLDLAAQQQCHLYHQVCLGKAAGLHSNSNVLGCNTLCTLSRKMSMHMSSLYPLHTCRAFLHRRNCPRGNSHPWQPLRHPHSQPPSPAPLPPQAKSSTVNPLMSFLKTCTSQTCLDKPSISRARLQLSKAGCLMWTLAC